MLQLPFQWNLKTPEDILDNFRVRPLLLGNGGYPLYKWKPYSFTPALNNFEKKFIEKLSSSRAIGEWSFGICKTLFAEEAR